MRPHLVYYMGQTLNCQPEAFHRPLHSILIGLPGLQGHAETQKPCYSSHMGRISLIRFLRLETWPLGPQTVEPGEARLLIPIWKNDAGFSIVSACPCSPGRPAKWNLLNPFLYISTPERWKQMCASISCAICEKCSVRSLRKVYSSSFDAVASVLSSGVVISYSDVDSSSSSGISL